MLSTAMIRDIGLSAASAGAGAVAAVSFAASHSVDLYAIYDQLNVVIADITKLSGMVIPLATGAYAAYKATTKSKLLDLSKDPDVKGVVTTPALAASIPDNKVVSTAAAMPQAAQTAKP